MKRAVLYEASYGDKNKELDIELLREITMAMYNAYSAVLIQLPVNAETLKKIDSIDVAVPSCI